MLFARVVGHSVSNNQYASAKPWDSLVERGVGQWEIESVTQPERSRFETASAPALEYAVKNHVMHISFTTKLWKSS